MNEFLEIINKSLDADSFLLLVLSKPDKTDSLISKTLKIRPIMLKGTTKYQVSSRTKTQEFHENLSKEELTERNRTSFGTTYLQAHLCTTDSDYYAKVNHDGKLVIKISPPSHSRNESEHNRKKNYLIPDGTPCPFLIETGVMNSDGLVTKKMYSKFRQINRFLELLDVVASALPAEKRLRIFDFGSGKSYLTFAVHYLFTQIHHRQVEIVAVDWNDEIVKHCQKIANNLSIHEITFRTSSIGDLKIEGEVDLVISLHACDTATDDVLAKAIEQNAKAIFAVPCCHHELTGLMHPRSMNGLLQHGILKEQTAALLTDALRAMVMEIRGYKTEVVEFIELEHTHKNLLIRGAKREQSLSHESIRVKKAEYEKLKRVWGIKKFHLESLVSI